MKEIVLSQKFERDELLEGRYVQREGLKNAKESLQSNLIKVIMGPRRAGKSVFLICDLLLEEGFDLFSKRQGGLGA